MKSRTAYCLVSVGRNNASRRFQKADLDARALEMALNLPNTDVVCLHASTQNEIGKNTQADLRALKDYLGMGALTLHHIQTPPHSDIVEPLAAILSDAKPDLIFAGEKAEIGRGSGLLPYQIAKALDIAIAPSAVAVTLADGQSDDAFTIRQALPKGRRRRLRAASPVLITASQHAPTPRLSAYGKKRQGQIICRSVSAPPDRWSSAVERIPARRRPQRLHANVIRGDARARLKAAFEQSANDGRLLVNPEPHDAAAEIFDFLKQLNLISKS